MGYLRLAPHHGNHLGGLVKLGVMLTKLWSLAVHIVVLGCYCWINFLVALFYGEKNLAASIPQFDAIQAMTVFVIHLALGFFSVLDIKVVYEGMRTVFGVRFCLLHPNSPHSPVPRKHLFESRLLWQFEPDWKSDEKSCAVSRREIVISNVSNYNHAPSIAVWKLDFHLEAFNF